MLVWLEGVTSANHHRLLLWLNMTGKMIGSETSSEMMVPPTGMPNAT